MKPGIQLRRGAPGRVRFGHPWVFANELTGQPDPAWDGEVIPCRDARGRILGWGIVNSRSQIVWRKLAGESVKLDRPFFETALKRAWERRGGPEAPPVCRLVWSESDALPGLIVDRYEDILVVQTLTLAMDRHLRLIADILVELSGTSGIVARNDAPVRQKEGLSSEVKTLYGELPQQIWIPLAGLEMSVDLQAGQKTGLYLDQRLEYSRVASRAAGREVLDACCHQGGFALACLKAGATSAVGVDSSASALEAARRNADHNQLEAEFIEANIFDFFRGRGQQTWDLIVLDPPPFAPNRSKLEGALRGYRELNLQAMRALRPGGILATYACSHVVTYDILRDLLQQAAGDARRSMRVLDICRQPDDHPIMVSIPESEYLRGYLLEVVG
jgi:23S rRNA (cytosine1962-C5)-methyltransferase